MPTQRHLAHVQDWFLLHHSACAVAGLAADRLFTLLGCAASVNAANAFDEVVAAQFEERGILRPNLCGDAVFLRWG
jgi:hypothetical protein